MSRPFLSVLLGLWWHVTPVGAQCIHQLHARKVPAGCSTHHAEQRRKCANQNLKLTKREMALKYFVVFLPKKHHGFWCTKGQRPQTE